MSIETQQVRIDAKAFQALIEQGVAVELADATEGVSIDIPSEESGASALTLAAGKAIGLVVRIPRGLYYWHD